MLFSFSSLFASVFIAGVSASNVIDLTPDNFDSIVGKGKPALVEFFAPWCGHCKNLAPVYEQVADAFHHVSDKVVIAKIDADGVGKPLGQKYGVTGFPTLKWFDAEGKPEDYAGGRDLEDFSSYISRKVAGIKAKIAPPPPTNVKTLDLHNWEEAVAGNKKNVLVSFTAPWCGHCKNLKPIYEKVATTFTPESSCVVANINADDQKNREISKKFGVAGFPTLKFFSAEDKENPIEYEGGRSEEDIVKFLNEKCGTQRAVGGGLNDEAGRLAQFDELAHKFFKASSDARASLQKEAKDLATSAGLSSKHYLYVMEKIANGSTEYVQKEAARLTKILEKRNLAPAKLDEIKKKANVLKSFLEERAKEVKETVVRAEAEL